MKDAISFDKGCYTGQETLARAKYRGTNNRSLFILEEESSTTKETLRLQAGENSRLLTRPLP